jgi:hypothetical protein
VAAAACAAVAAAACAAVAAAACAILARWRFGHVDGVRQGLNNIDGPDGKRMLIQGAAQE